MAYLNETELKQLPIGSEISFDINGNKIDFKIKQHGISSFLDEFSGQRIFYADNFFKTKNDEL